MSPRRPGHKELTKKLQDGLEATQANRIRVIEPIVIVADAIEIGYDFQSELQLVLLELLNASSPEFYVGQRPPQRSYETQLLNLELFPFSVHSSYLKLQIYYKFAFKNSFLYLVSLHKDRP